MDPMAEGWAAKLTSYLEKKLSLYQQITFALSYYAQKNSDKRKRKIFYKFFSE